MLETLPAQDIIFPKVFTRLSPRDLFNLRASSTCFHHLVSVFLSINRSLDLGYDKRITASAFLILTKDAQNLRYLHLSGLKFLTDDLLAPVIGQNVHLLSLELSECHHLTSSILQIVSSRTYQLQRLILRDCHWVSREAIEYHVHKQGHGQVKSCLALEKLSAQCIRVGRKKDDNSTSNTPRSNLEEIVFTGCWELSDDVLINFVSKFPQLRIIRLGNIYSITDDCLNGIAKFCPKIHTLDITGCWRVTDSGVSMIGEYCRDLEELSVSDCRDVTEQSLTRLRQRGVKVDRQLDPVLLRLMRIRNEQRHGRLQV